MKSEVESASPKKKGRTSKGKTTADPTVSVKLTWSLHELPSSQHRAGLAGLALAVAFLARKTERRGVCRVSEINDDGLTLEVDRAGMQSLFDDIYAATTEETSNKTKWAGTEPKRIDEVEVRDEKTRKTKTEKRFVYDQVVPSGLLIQEWDATPAGGKRVWLALWQEFVWKTLRGVPATRQPFNARAASRASTDGADTWDELTAQGEASVPLPSTYYLGAQAESAEMVAFEDRARFRFLLHFWPLVAGIYVPSVLHRDGKREFAGHAITIADVASLEAFVDAWERTARSRGCEVAGYVPREAVVDLPDEAGLDLIRRTNEQLSARLGAAATRASLAAVDVFHVERDGNNVRVRTVARIVPERLQDDEYARVRAAGYWSPVFRRQRVTNVLSRRPWYFGFARLCATTPQEMTIEHDPFQHDCRKAFMETEMKQDVPDDDQTLEHLVFKRVQAYVLGKVERKYDLSWSRVQGKPGEEKDYRERKEKVAREAFLGVRSRTGADFVAYFTGTICSVPHSANETKYLTVARALMDPEQAERVRSLTLLALSAVA